MAFPIGDLKTEVAAYLAARGDTVPHYLGAEHLSDADAPPRYVWIPTTDTPRDPIQGSRTQRAIYSFDESFVLHCWGEDFDQAYTLRNNAIVAMRAAGRADFRVLESGWFEPEDEQKFARGRVYLLRASLGVPVVEAIQSTITITAEGQLTQEGSMLFPQSEVTEC